MAIYKWQLLACLLQMTAYILISLSMRCSLPGILVYNSFMVRALSKPNRTIFVTCPYSRCIISPILSLPYPTLSYPTHAHSALPTRQCLAAIEAACTSPSSCTPLARRTLSSSGPAWIWAPVQLGWPGVGLQYTRPALGQPEAARSQQPIGQPMGNMCDELIHRIVID
jgi:hypothetical protein